MRTKTKQITGQAFLDIASKILNECQAKDGNQYAFNGIFYDSKNQNTVSSDGRRLCIVEGIFKEEFSDKVIRYTKTGFEVIDARFPNYLGIMPLTYSYHFKFTMPVFDKKQKNVFLHVNKIADKYEIAFSYPQKSEFAQSLKTGNGFKISLNSNYLNTISGFDVEFSFNDDNSPVQFKLLNQNLEVVEEITYIVMPMRH